jgi:PAS domain S-box-containing protein
VTLASIGDAVITTDAQGRVTFLNGEAERLTGWKNAEAAGQPLPTVFHIINEETRATAEDPVKKVFRTGSVVGLANHTVLIARDGREFVIDDSGAPIRQADGTITGVVLVFRDNTEKKRAENALRRDEPFLLQTGHIAKVGGWEFDPVTGQGHWSEEVARIHDLEPDTQPTKESGVAFYHGESRARIEAAVQLAIEYGTPYDLELEIVSAKGAHKWIRTICQPLVENGKVVRVCGALQDITERRQAEAALREGRERLQRILDHTRCIVSLGEVSGPAGWELRALEPRSPFVWNFPVINPETAQAVLPLVLAPGELYDRAWTRSRHADDHIQMNKNSGQALLTGVPFYRNEFRCTDKAGKLHWMQQHVSVQKISDARWQIFGITTDVTELKTTQERYREEHALLRTLFDLAPDFIFVKDTEGRYLMVNDALARCYGRSPAEIVNGTDADFLPPELAARFRAGEQQTLAADSFRTFEDTITYPDGQPRAVLTNMVAFRDPAGKVAGLVGIGRDVTAQKAIEKSMRLQSVALEAAANSILITDHNGSIEWVNPAFTRSTGYSLAECLGKNPRKLLRSGQHDREFYKNLWDTILAGQVWHGEMINRRKDGSLFEEEVTITPLLDRENRTTHFIAIRQDITERKRLEEEFAREQARFKLIFDAVPVGIAFHTVHADGKFTRTINDAHLRICGLTREQHDQPGIYTRITHPDDWAIQQRFNEEVKAGTRKYFSMEKRYLHPDGKVVWVDFSYQREIYPDGAIEELTTVVDITGRKAVEQQLMQLAVIVESSEDAIISNTLDGIITSWNRGAEIIFGYPAGETVGQPMRMLFPDELKHEEADILARIARDESVEHFETERLRKDGTRIRVSATISPLKDGQGKIVGASTIARDTTRQHILEEQLRQSQKMEAIGQLAGGVAHDFNNILAVIQMQTELSKIEGNFTREQLGCLNEIQVAANRAAKLTRQLLLFSRRQRLQPRELDLSDSITGMTKMLRRILGEDIQMQFKYAPQPLFILADAGMMDQVLMNLTLNSRDAMPNGGELVIETAAVELAASEAATTRPGAFVRLSVSDTGCGIPPEIQPRIFEPFFNTKDVGKGTGLGLATVFSIVQQHQGWISVASQPGQGTTFHIYLPRLAKTSVRPPVVESAPAAASGGTETILLVEDDDALRASVRKSLAQLGYRLLEAASGSAVLQVWQQHRDEIHLLLTDLVMPGGMSGKELGERLLQENPKLKVIYASGYSAEVAGKDFPLAEGVNFLSKPFPVQTLTQTIRACLDRI